MIEAGNFLHRPVPAGSPWRGAVAILAGCACFAAGTLITKALLGSFSALPLVFLQLMASCVAIWSIAAATGRLPSLRQAPRLALPGFLQPGLAYILIYVGLETTPVTIEGLLLALETAFVVLFAWALLGERPGRTTVVATIVATVGVVMISGVGRIGVSPPPLLGVLLILAGVIAASLDTVVSRALAIDADPLVMTAASHAAGLALVAATIPLWPADSLEHVGDLGPLAGIIVSGLLMHGLATVLFNWGLGRVRAGTAATLFPSISLMTATGGMVWFSERLSLGQLVGGGLILAAAGAVAVSLARVKRHRQAQGSGKIDMDDDLKVLSRDQLMEEVRRLRAKA